MTVSFRALFAILIAAAMLFAPLAIQSGGVMAMAPSVHSGQIMDSGHCDGPSGKQREGATPGSDCCMAMCTGLAVAPSGAAEPVPGSKSANSIGRFAKRDGISSKLPTPPPRLA